MVRRQEGDTNRNDAFHGEKLAGGANTASCERGYRVGGADFNKPLNSLAGGVGALRWTQTKSGRTGDGAIIS